MKTVIRHAAKLTVAFALIVVALPFILVASDLPKQVLASGPSLEFHRTDLGTTSAKLETWKARDGSKLGFRRYPSGNPNAPLMIMIHGSGLHGGQFEQLATTLAAGGVADVLVPDLRGHGPSPERRGDVNYIGQLEDDLAAIIGATARTDQEVVLLGHSSGGGLVVRFAGGVHGAMMDRAVLLAPYLGHNAPTTRPKAGGWAHPLLRRYVGLEILNGFGVTAFNGLTVVQLNVPDSIQTDGASGTMTAAYSYRLNTSYHPRTDLGADVARLPDVLLIAGAEDEAFVAELYQPTMETFTARGAYHIIPDVQHMDVVDAPATSDLIKEFLEQ